MSTFQRGQKSLLQKLKITNFEEIEKFICLTWNWPFDLTTNSFLNNFLFESHFATKQLKVSLFNGLGQAQPLVIPVTSNFESWAP